MVFAKMKTTALLALLLVSCVQGQDVAPDYGADIVSKALC
jgi:hypothetical protein